MSVWKIRAPLATAVQCHSVGKSLPAAESSLEAPAWKATLMLKFSKLWSWSCQRHLCFCWSYCFAPLLLLLLSWTSCSLAASLTLTPWLITDRIHMTHPQWMVCTAKCLSISDTEYIWTRNTHLQCPHWSLIAIQSHPCQGLSYPMNCPYIQQKQYHCLQCKPIAYLFTKYSYLSATFVFIV